MRVPTNQLTMSAKRQHQHDRRRNRSRQKCNVKRKGDVHQHGMLAGSFEGAAYGGEDAAADKKLEHLAEQLGRELSCDYLWTPSRRSEMDAYVTSATEGVVATQRAARQKYSKQFLKTLEDESVLGADCPGDVPAVLTTADKTKCSRLFPVHCLASYPQTAAVRNARCGLGHHCHFSSRHGESPFAEPAHVPCAVNGVSSKWLGGLHMFAAVTQLHRAAYAMALMWPCLQQLLRETIEKYTHVLERHRQRSRHLASGRAACASDGASECGRALHILFVASKFAFGVSQANCDAPKCSRWVVCCDHGTVNEFVESIIAPLDALHRLVVCAAVCAEAQNPGAVMCAATNILGLMSMSSEFDHVEENMFARTSDDSSTADASASLDRDAAMSRVPTHVDTQVSETENEWKLSWYSQSFAMCPTVHSPSLSGDYLAKEHAMHMLKFVEDVPKRESQCADERKRYEKTVLEASLKYPHVLTSDMQYPDVNDSHVPKFVMKLEMLRDAMAQMSAMSDVTPDFVIHFQKLDMVTSNYQWCISLVMRCVCKIQQSMSAVWLGGESVDDEFDASKLSAHQCLFIAQEWRRCARSMGIGYEDFDNMANGAGVSSVASADANACATGIKSTGEVSKRAGAEGMHEDEAFRDRVKEEVLNGFECCFALPECESILKIPSEYTPHNAQLSQSVNVREAAVTWTPVSSATEFVTSLSAFCRKTSNAVLEYARLGEMVSRVGKNTKVGTGMSHKVFDSATRKVHDHDNLEDSVYGKLASEAPSFPFSLFCGYFDSHAHLHAHDAAMNRLKLMYRFGNPALRAIGMANQESEEHERQAKDMVFLIHKHRHASRVPAHRFCIQSPNFIMSSCTVYDDVTCVKDGAGHNHPPSMYSISRTRAGAFKIAGGVVPVSFGTFAAVCRVVKFNHMFNQLYAVVCVNMAVEFAVTGACASRRKGATSNGVSLHVGAPQAMDIVNKCSFLRSMPSVDIACLQYLKAHTSCRIFRMCTFAGMYPPNIVGNMTSLNVMRDAMPSDDAMKLSINVVISQLTFFAQKCSEAARDFRSGKPCTSASQSALANTRFMLTEEDRAVIQRHCREYASAWEESDGVHGHADIYGYDTRCLQSLFTVLMGLQSKRL